MWALWIIFGLIVLVTLALCIPVQTTFTIDTSSPQRYRLRASWLFGLVRKDIRKKRKPPRKKKEGTGLLSYIRSYSKISRFTGLMPRLSSLAMDIYHRLKAGTVHGDLRIGLEDPALTGIVFAVIGPVNAMLNLLPNYSVSLHPVFEDEDILEGHLNGSVTVRPVRLMIPALRFGLSREVLRAGKVLAGERWRQRKRSRENR